MVNPVPHRVQELVLLYCHLIGWQPVNCHDEPFATQIIVKILIIEKMKIFLMLFIFW